LLQKITHKSFRNHYVLYKFQHAAFVTLKLHIPRDKIPKRQRIDRHRVQHVTYEDTTWLSDQNSVERRIKAPLALCVQRPAHALLELDEGHTQHRLIVHLQPVSRLAYQLVYSVVVRLRCPRE
jgi:hypothetical protein